ncbi:MAG: HNH endonuclease signature motif containing protein [Calditrichia bacterium]
MARKSTGKRLRFEIFKRDGFRCVYCGATPTQSVLHADHVIPVAEGGPTTADNLITACQDCNLGKSSISLDEKKLAKPISTKAHEEHAEQIKAYLAIEKEILKTRQKAADDFAEYWETIIGPMSEEMYNRLDGLIRTWAIDKLTEAASITARKLGDPKSEFYSWNAKRQAKYFHGILRKWKLING